MSLNIKNLDVVRLVNEVAAITGETKTEAIRTAMEHRRLELAHLRSPLPKGTRFLRYLEEEIWPNLSKGQLGAPLTRDEEAEILGFGPDGV